MIELVVQALEHNIRKEYPTAILILEKYKEPCKIKMFQKQEYILWYKKDINSPHQVVFKVQLTDRVTSEDEQKQADKTIQLRFLETLLEYLKGDVIWKS